MNGVIWWGGKPIPIEMFAEMLNTKIKEEKEQKEDTDPP
jgi:hypothetical protein